jgi:RimJ/RimL family protein N-acetyltransferase
LRYLLDQHDALVAPWVAGRVNTTWSPGRSHALGLFCQDQGIIAGVLYEGYNGANIGAHIAAVEGSGWASRMFLRSIFHYPFVQLHCKRITGVVASSNAKARHFNERVGMKLEHVLKDAHPEGDLLLYVMRREDCKWL